MILDLPLTSDPSRSVTVTMGDADYKLVTRYNDRSSVWTLDILSPSDDSYIVAAAPIVLGSDILEPFGVGIGRMLVIDMSAAPGSGTEAGPDDLGVRVRVLWISEDEDLG